VNLCLSEIRDEESSPLIVRFAHLQGPVRAVIDGANVGWHHNLSGREGFDPEKICAATKYFRDRGVTCVTFIPAQYLWRKVGGWRIFGRILSNFFKQYERFGSLTLVLLIIIHARSLTLKLSPLFIIISRSDDIIVVSST
jgi:hypothetical protein